MVLPIASISLVSAQVTSRASVSASGGQADASSGIPSVSSDGDFLAFESSASTLVPGAGFRSDVFLKDRRNGAIEWISVNTSGGLSDDFSFDPCVSGDGRFVAFDSYSTDLVAGDLNGASDAFIRDRVAGTTLILSLSSAGVQGNNTSATPRLSADGRFAVFVSYANNLVPGDMNGLGDVFVRDRQDGLTEIVSISTGGSQTNAQFTLNPAISGDGRFVVFDSAASTLVSLDANMARDVFVRDRLAGVTSLVSVSSLGVQGEGMSEYPAVSADGRFVAFDSFATNLVPGDVDGVRNVFLRDLMLNTTEMVSLASDGTAVAGARASLSADGRYVTFVSGAAAVPGDQNGDVDLFVRDRVAGTTILASLDSSGVQGDDDSWPGVISADGRIVAFPSWATTLVPGDTNAAGDIFVRHLGTAISPFCLGDGSGTPCPCGNSGAPGRGCENSSSTGGAMLTATGTASLASDSLVLTASGERPTVLTIVLQGNDSAGPLLFGDGLRCAGGILKRLYAKVSVAGVVTVPQGGDLPVSARSAALGDIIPAGASRFYQTWYRDSVAGFCPDPPGKNWNASSGLAVVWDY